MMWELAFKAPLSSLYLFTLLFIQVYSNYIIDLFKEPALFIDCFIFVCWFSVLFIFDFIFIPFFLFFKLINLFVFIFGCVGSSLLCTGFLQSASQSNSSQQCMGFPLSWLLLLQSTGSRRVAEHRLQARELQYLWHADSVVVVHGLSCSAACGIFRVRDRTCVPCIGRRILNHCSTREAVFLFFFCFLSIISFRAQRPIF